MKVSFKREKVVKKCAKCGFNDEITVYSQTMKSLLEKQEHYCSTCIQTLNKKGKK